MSKKCNTCGEIKELGEFGKRKTSKDGRRNNCKSCSNSYCRKWKKDNETPEMRRKSKVKFGLDRVAASNKRYRENNKESIREYNKIVAASGRQRKGRAVREQNRRLSLSSVKLSLEDWQSRLDYYGGRCIYCKSDENIQIEHRVPVSRGGTNLPANLVPACKSCNCSKGTKTEKEFKQHLALKGN